ncbi:MAG: DUF3553 domain-containing protein [Rhodoferax sp.]|nr:DUF3553 domain-containing protein [Rhodoferax sp.]
MTLPNRFAKGTRVRHIFKPEWGVGQLLEDSNSETIRIFFEGSGERAIQLTASEKLTVVTGVDAQSSLLDNCTFQLLESPAQW